MSRIHNTKENIKLTHGEVIELVQDRFLLLIAVILLRTKSIVDNTWMFFSLPKKGDFHPISDLASETWDRYWQDILLSFLWQLIFINNSTKNQ